jgi:hypothetical protein
MSRIRNASSGFSREIPDIKKRGIYADEKKRPKGGGNFSRKIFASLQIGELDELTKERAFGPGLRIRIHFIRIRIQHFRLNTDPDPGL